MYCGKPRACKLEFEAQHIHKDLWYTQVNILSCAIYSCSVHLSVCVLPQAGGRWIHLRDIQVCNSIFWNLTTVFLLRYQQLCILLGILTVSDNVTFPSLCKRRVSSCILPFPFFVLSSEKRFLVGIRYSEMFHQGIYRKTQLKNYVNYESKPVRREC